MASRNEAEALGRPETALGGWSEVAKADGYPNLCDVASGARVALTPPVSQDAAGADPATPTNNHRDAPKGKPPPRAPTTGETERTPGGNRHQHAPDRSRRTCLSVQRAGSIPARGAIQRPGVAPHIARHVPEEGDGRPRKRRTGNRMATARWATIFTNRPQPLAPAQARMSMLGSSLIDG